MTVLIPAERFHIIETEVIPETPTGLRFRLSQSALGRLILKILDCCCCYRYFDPTYMRMEDNRHYLIRHRPHLEDPSYSTWIRAVNRVNNFFPHYRRIDIHHHSQPVYRQTTHVSVPPASRPGYAHYSSQASAPVILNASPTYNGPFPNNPQVVHQHIHTTHHRHAPSTPMFNPHSQPSYNIHAQHSSNRPTSVQPSQPNISNRPTSVAQGTRRINH